MQLFPRIASMAVLFLASTQLLHAQQKYSWKTAHSGGYEYKYVENDPSQARFYTLQNGLTVILSPTPNEPRIQTYIAVKAGSKTDPANHTGLAHYLEHMLFKGTDQYGTLDWEKEEPLLNEIEKLYEKYNSTTDEAERAGIYRQIDKISGQAAKFAIANEYDKLMSGMGAKGTNAFTSFEQTVYTEDVPSNVIDKYLAVQSERFRKPVFRIFHTELEAVYEEKNRSLDNDPRKVVEEMFKLLFPHNNYGKQTTIGTIEHLKNPSLVEIRKYFDTYYVPNNMGIIMAGDLDPDEVIKKIDRSFGYMKPKPIPPYVFEPEKEIRQPLTAEVFGPEQEMIMLGYRFPGASSDDAQILTLVSSILANGSAGLIDLNLVKKQQLLGAYAFPYLLKDYSIFLLQGLPNQNQSLEEVKSLLLKEIEKLKAGDFSDDLITSIINNEKKRAIEVNEKYSGRASELMYSFTSEVDWIKNVAYVERLNSITKKDIVDFANKYLGENYVAVYKRQGEDKNLVKVEKPAITPITVNREAQSAFLNKIASMPENEITPLWLDYSKDIKRTQADKYEVLSVKNNDNQLFRLHYYYETGSWSNKLLPIAADYLEYLGTGDKTTEDISREFYQLASSFRINVGSEQTYITIDGLQENFDKAIGLFDNLLHNCKADQAVLDAYLTRLRKSRENKKLNKGQIMQGLTNYAQYGPQNPFNHELTDEELDDLKAEDLINVLHDLAQYPHQILYYGPESADKIANRLKKTHPAPARFVALPPARRFVAKDQEENQVLLAHYDMVQAEIYWVRNSGKYDEKMIPEIYYFNEYFGGGMGSVVFQTVRESKALAYATFAYYETPNNAEYRNAIKAYVGTQSDKLPDAIDAMNELLNDLPHSEKAIRTAKEGVYKKLASDRITQDGIIFSYLNAKRMGRDFDIRKKIYDHSPNISFESLKAFHNKEMKNKTYTYCVLAGEGKVSDEKLNALGKVKLLSLEEIFGY